MLLSSTLAGALPCAPTRRPRARGIAPLLAAIALGAAPSPADAAGPLFAAAYAYDTGSSRAPSRSPISTPMPGPIWWC